MTRRKASTRIFDPVLAHLYATLLPGICHHHWCGDLQCKSGPHSELRQRPLHASSCGSLEHERCGSGLHTELGWLLCVPQSVSFLSGSPWLLCVPQSVAISTFQERGRPCMRCDIPQRPPWAPRAPQSAVRINPWPAYAMREAAGTARFGTHLRNLQPKTPLLKSDVVAARCAVLVVVVVL